jgi:hypothetical protein
LSLLNNDNNAFILSEIRRDRNTKDFNISNGNQLQNRTKLARKTTVEVDCVDFVD